MKKSFKILLFSVLVTIVIVLAFIYRPVQFGGGSYYFTISSGSMEPALGTGDWVVCSKVSFKDVAVGDIVAVKSPSNPKNVIVHRIIEKGEDYLLTKGDYCDLPDNFNTTAESLLARYTGFKIPKLGYLLAFSRSLYGLIFVYCVPCSIVIFIYARKLWKLRKSGQPVLSNLENV